MDFGSAVGSAFRRAGDFRGTSSRAEYWYFFLLSTTIQISAFAIDLVGTYPMFTTVAFIWTLVALVPAMSLFIRRLRDAGYSPWMTLFALAGPLGAIVFVVLLSQPTAQDGTRSPEGAIRRPVTNSISDSGPDDELDSQASSTRSRRSRILLGTALLLTFVSIVGSAIYLAIQSSDADAKAAVSASKASVAAASRQKIVAAASASASAARQAEADRQAKVLKAERDAEASKLAAASQAAAATARASAAARDKFLSEGWAEGPDGVFYSWVPASEAKCPAHQRCVQLKVTTPDGCSNGVSVDASELTQGTVTGSSYGYSPGFVAGQKALVTITTHDENSDSVSIKKMTCR